MPGENEKNRQCGNTDGSKGEVGIASSVLYHRLEVQGMEKAVEIYFYCKEMRQMLNEIANDINFVDEALSSTPETDFRNRRIEAQLSNITNKCFKMHMLSADIENEVQNDAETV